MSTYSQSVMNKNKILIAEKETMLGLELESTLKSLGYEVTSIVTVGNDLFKKSKLDQPDLVLLDIHLNGDKSVIAIAEMIEEKLKIPIILSVDPLDGKNFEQSKATTPFPTILKPIATITLRIS